MKRKAITIAKVMVEDFASTKAQFLSNIQAFVKFEEISLELVFNWDHTGIQNVLVSSFECLRKKAQIELRWLGLTITIK